MLITFLTLEEDKKQAVFHLSEDRPDGFFEKRENQAEVGVPLVEEEPPDPEPD